MYLKKIKNSLKTIHFRLALIFSLLFIISSGIIFTFSFLFIYNSIHSSEEGEIKRRLLNYWALFQSDGLDLVLEEIDKESFLYGDQPFFTRIADKNNRTLFLRYPEAWTIYSIEKLEENPITDFEKTMTLGTDNSENILRAHTVFLSENYILQIGISTARSAQLLRLYRRYFIFLLIGLVTLGFGAGILISRRFLSPIRSLNSALNEILLTGDFSKRVSSRGIKDDLNEVISLFNKMLKRIETLIFQMKENMDIVAHDLRTPLTIFRGYAEQALQNPDDPVQAAEALSVSLEQSEKIINMLNTIMDISEAESGTLKLKKEVLDFDYLVTSLVEMYEFISEERNIIIDLKTTICRIFADPVRIRQAIGNIIDNSIKYSPNNSKINISIEILDNTIVLKIKDSGPGIAKEDLPFIFDRLYRSPQVKNIQGTGLGLSLVKAVISAHSGSIEISSSPDKGSEFRIYFQKY